MGHLEVTPSHPKTKECLSHMNPWGDRDPNDLDEFLMWYWPADPKDDQCDGIIRQSYTRSQDDAAGRSSPLEHIHATQDSKRTPNARACWLAG